jgi:hypothetical protein
MNEADMQFEAFSILIKGRLEHIKEEVNEVDESIPTQQSTHRIDNLRREI